MSDEAGPSMVELLRQQQEQGAARNGQAEGHDEPPEPELDDGAGPDRPIVVITTDEDEVNQQATAALASELDLFHRGGVLVRVVRQERAETDHGVLREEGAPRILPLDEPTLRLMCARTARWAKPGKKGKLYPAHPPEWAVKQVIRAATWPGLRRLAGVIEAPALLPDGTVLDVPGYHAGSGLLYEPSGTYPRVSDHPTHEQAKAAAERLLALVKEFDFAGDAHPAVWLACLLTVLARPAIAGPCPLFLFDAPTAGSGKTLLARLVGLISTGREPPISELSTEAEEVRKSIGAIVMEGDRLVVLDNASGTFGCAPLDSVLTAPTYKARILGRSQRTADLAVQTVWIATGNNLRLRGDTHRRVVPCRLVPRCERPEERSGWAIPDLAAHVLEHRGKLLVDGLTMLRAHALAGRPAADLPEMGTFERWGAVVRQCINWCTGLDPCATRQDCISAESRGDANILAAVLAGWSHLPGGTSANDGVTTKRALELARQADGSTHRHYALREALECWAKEGEAMPDIGRLSYKLRAAKDRVAGRWMLRGASGGHEKVAKWWVQRVEEKSAGDACDAGDPPPATYARTPTRDSMEPLDVSPASHASPALPWEEIPR
jgi:hypothetical protein